MRTRTVLSTLIVLSLAGCMGETPADASSRLSDVVLALAIDDAETRRSTLAPLFADDAVASLPERAGVGREGVLDLLASSAAITAGSTVDAHHDVARVRVARGDARGLLMIQSSDVGITRLALLDDPLPDVADHDATTTPALTAYEGAWAATDTEARAALLDDALARDGRYVDPTADVTGRRALGDHIAGFQQQMPTASIVGTSGILVQHDVLHFTWHMDLVKDAVPFTDGMDVIFTEGDGRIALVAGFFGPLVDDE